MLKHIATEDVERIAQLAKAARDARDVILSEVREQDLGQPKPARGEHNPAAALGLDPLPFDHPARKALRQMIAELSTDARRELQALVWIARGDYGAAQWDKAFADSASIVDLPAAQLTSEADLHELLMKGLYELKLS
jgi:hypothetical protein